MFIHEKQHVSIVTSFQAAGSVSSMFCIHFRCCVSMSYICYYVRLSAGRLNQRAVCLSSPVLLRQFLTSIFINVDIRVRENGLFCDVLTDKGPLYPGQVCCALCSFCAFLRVGLSVLSGLGPIYPGQVCLCSQVWVLSTLDRSVCVVRSESYLSWTGLCALSSLSLIYLGQVCLCC